MKSEGGPWRRSSKRYFQTPKIDFSEAINLEMKLKWIWPLTKKTKNLVVIYFIFLWEKVSVIPNLKTLLNLFFLT